MNGKTAKLLRRYGTSVKRKVRPAARAWAALPAKERAKRREQMEAQLEKSGWSVGGNSRTS